MTSTPLLLQQLMDHFQQLPGIGAKTAQRLALYVLTQPESAVARFAQTMQSARARIKPCERCHFLTDQALCYICSDPNRHQALLCVVTDTRDVLALEKTGEFRGLYHVLEGLISPLDGIGPDQLTIRRLLTRLHPPCETREIILALPPSIEGDTTSLYLTRLLPPDIVVSRIAYGLPAGGELEYADPLTLNRALSGRTTVSR